MNVTVTVNIDDEAHTEWDEKYEKVISLDALLFNIIEIQKMNDRKVSSLVVVLTL